MRVNRREFLGSIVATSLGLAAPSQPRYRVGITTNTRGGWEKDVFLSFREAHEVGYHYVESFINYFTAYLDKPAELQKKIDEIGVNFVTISTAGPPQLAFYDPSQRPKLLHTPIRSCH